MNGITGINAFYGLRTNYYANNKPAFKGSRQIFRTCTMGMTAAALLALTSCNNKKQDVKSENLTEVVEKKDSTKTFENTNDKPKRYFYYYPRSNNEINSGNYDWSETVYPDGSIERDSAGYKITISPSGERTVIKTQKDNKGNTTTTTTEYNDGTKMVFIDFETKIPVESNDSIKQNEVGAEIDSTKITKDSVKTDSIKTQKQIFKFYNEKNILLYWDVETETPERKDSINIYDNQGRLIYDCAKNEKYEYKNKRKTPYLSVTELEGCKRYTIYRKDGSVKSIYFEASDGTKTKLDEMDFFKQNIR